MAILALICQIISLVCWIMVLVKMFTQAGALQGIIGIICGLWAFISGWMNAKAWQVEKVMMIWTAAIIGGIIFSIMSGDFSGLGE